MDVKFSSERIANVQTSPDRIADISTIVGNLKERSNRIVRSGVTVLTNLTTSGPADLTRGVHAHHHTDGGWIALLTVSELTPSREALPS